MQRHNYLFPLAAKYLALTLGLLLITATMPSVKLMASTHLHKSGPPLRKQAALHRHSTAVNDPIRFTLQANKRQVHVGEEIELTITAELLNVSSKLMFFLEGANAYSLKLLTPKGFEQTDGQDALLMDDALSLTGRSTTTYHIRGKFTSAMSGTCFRLLRSERYPTNESRYVEKATLCYQTSRNPNPASASKSTSASSAYVLLDEGSTTGARIAGGATLPDGGIIAAKMNSRTVNNPRPTNDIAGLTFTITNYDCTSGVVHYQFAGGDGSVIYVSMPGAFAGNVYAGNDNTATIDSQLRTGTNFTGTASQSGQQMNISFPANCNYTPPTTPPASGTSTIACVEAETSNGDGNRSASSDSQASNGQSVGGFGNNSEYMSYTIPNIPASSTYTLNLYYVSGDNQAGFGLVVNGNLLPVLTAPGVGRWSGPYSVVTVSVTLNQGTNTIRIQGSGQGNFVLDKLCVTGGGSTVSPAGNTLTIMPASGSTQYVSTGAGIQSVTVTSTITWTVSSSDASWLKVGNPPASTSTATGNGVLGVTYAANASSSPRTASITFSGQGVVQTLTFTQSAANTTPVPPINNTQVFVWSQTNTADTNDPDLDYLGVGPATHENAPVPEYINEMVAAGVKAIWISVNRTHYQRGRLDSDWGRMNCITNQTARCRTLGVPYYFRSAIGLDYTPYSNSFNGLMTIDDAAKMNDGVSVAYNNNSAVPKLYLLRDFVSGGSQNTDNPWYWAKKYIERWADFLRQDISDGICQGVSFTLGGRWEDFYSSEFSDDPNLRRFISDYAPGTVANFKTRTGLNQDPPPANTSGDMTGSFTGAVGKAWYVHGEDDYIYYKNWVTSIFNARISQQGGTTAARMAADFGQYIGGQAPAGRTINFPKIGNTCQIWKFNPARFDSPFFVGDAIRSNAVQADGSIRELHVEEDQDFLNDDALTIRQRREHYFAMGVKAIVLGQMYGPRYATALQSIKDWFTAHPTMGTIPTITTTGTATFTASEELGGNSFILGHWQAAGGTETKRIDIKLNDDLRP